MLLITVAPRPRFHAAGGRRCVSSRADTGRWRAVLGVGVGTALLTAVAQGAPNPLWPPSTELSSTELASSTYWPSDDAYGYGYASSSDDAEREGQWWLYSFVPERSTTSVVLREPQLASGLSVDLAWRLTQGNSQVTLGILDDGIDWSEPDLADKIFLNVGELGDFPPTKADGTPCAPIGDADSPRVDCSLPPDGILSVSDYRELLGWTDQAVGLDPNGNGILDPEDIISSFSDGIDNDGNGFVDDIAGWDFVDFDNLPLGAHNTSGTVAALDALAKTNNDYGLAGVCPHCRGLPVRVGEQRGSSPQTLALGLLYTSAMGASASLVGHLPEGRARILDAALRSSAARNMLTLFPRDGERQTTPLFRLDSDATKTIGSLTQLNGTTTTTGSFVALDPCQTVESYPTLMAAAPSCSRRGPAIALGIAGLAASSARSDSAQSRLSAFELGASLESNADRIDVASYYGSSDGTSQRFDTSRLNANRTVTNLSRNLVPGEIDLESPHQYDTFPVENLSLSLPIVGRISARRASTFDVFVELAQGAVSADGKFTVVSDSKLLGLPANEPFGSGSTITTINIRSWYKSSASSPPTSTGSGSLVTLRIRTVAHYSQPEFSPNTTTESSVYRQLVVVDDERLLPGFPYALDASPTPPKLVDVDGDNVKEIVIGTLDGRLLALGANDGSPVDRFANTVFTRLHPSFQRFPHASAVDPSAKLPAMFGGMPAVAMELGTEAIVGPVASADLDGDGRIELVFAGKTGRVYVVNADGSHHEGWPRCLQSPEAVDCRASNSQSDNHAASVVLADIDGDGSREIVVASKDGHLYAFEHTGEIVSGWPLYFESQEGLPYEFSTSPAAADLDGDQIDDLIVNSGEPRDPKRPFGSFSFVILGAKPPRTPSLSSDWPLTTTSYDFLVDTTTRQSPATAIDSQPSRPRALLYGNATIPYFVPVETGGLAAESDVPRNAEPNRDDGNKGLSLVEFGADSKVTDPSVIAPLFARPTLADLDRDGITDVVLPVSNVSTIEALRNPAATEHASMLGFWSGKTGKMLPGSPIVLDDFVGTATPAIADLTGDGYPEMILPSGSGALVAYDACGRTPEGWPKLVGGTMSQSPTVGDINGDGTLDVVVATDDGRIFAWATDAPTNSYVPWEGALHDNDNRSAHRIPTGTIPSFPGPLALTTSGQCFPRSPDEPETDPEPELSARGGCGCHVPGHPTPSSGRYLFCSWLVVALLRRLRLRRSPFARR